jgi:hypothetical protein
MRQGPDRSSLPLCYSESASFVVVSAQAGSFFIEKLCGIAGVRIIMPPPGPGAHAQFGPGFSRLFYEFTHRVIRILVVAKWLIL